MTKRKLPLISVAIPAYNEAENIGNILDSLIGQKMTKVKLSSIDVYTDGSTDTTVEKVKQKMKKYKNIHLFQGKNRRGKFYRLNQIFKANRADVLIVLDADIGLVGKKFLENFAQALLTDKGATIVSAHEVLLWPEDFLGRVIASSYLIWDYIRWSIPNYDHVQNMYVRATAYSRTLTQKLHIPEEATEERMYLYLMGKKTQGFRYTKKAVIRYWPVTTIYDYQKLSERAFGRPQPAVNKQFGFDATPLYTIPRKYKVIGTLKSFIHHPFYTPLGFLLGIALSKFTLSRKSADSAIWEMSLSSKRSIRL